MTTEESQKLKIPGFKYNNFDVPALELSHPLINNLETNEPIYNLAPKSAPLAWKVGLYMVGSDLEKAKELENFRGRKGVFKEAEGLPESVREAAKMVYSDCQKRRDKGTYIGSWDKNVSLFMGGGIEKGVWHKDAVIFMPRSETPKGMRQPENDDYALARYFKDIEGFEEKNGVWTIKPSVQTEESIIWLPKGGQSYVVPTMDGIYHPVTGTPFETVDDLRDAWMLWALNGPNMYFIERETEREISKFSRPCFIDYSNTMRAVSSRADIDYGPLYINLNYEVWESSPNYGSFSAIRSDVKE